MQTVKFLCEFFFANFWHWLGLLIIVMAIFKIPVKINVAGRNENKKEREDMLGWMENNKSKR